MSTIAGAAWTWLQWVGFGFAAAVGVWLLAGLLDRAQGWLDRRFRRLEVDMSAPPVLWDAVQRPWPLGRVAMMAEEIEPAGGEDERPRAAEFDKLSLKVQRERISRAIGYLKAIQAGRGNFANRPLSVAITQLETGEMWLEKAIQEGEEGKPGC